jgi:hypothetical protein
MTWYGVNGDRYDRHGHAYMEIGSFETEDYGKARDKAYDYASSHPNAAAQILRDGDPYQWVHHTYDRGKDEDTVIIKTFGDIEVRVNGRTVSDTSKATQPTFDGWMLGEI